jgi:myosin-crossreactive antigen
MSGPCDDELYNPKFNSSYGACDFIKDNIDNCSGESIINYRVLYFCHLNQNLYISIPLAVNVMNIL